MSTSYPAHASPRPDFGRQPSHAMSEFDLHTDGVANGDGSTASVGSSPSTPPSAIHQPKPTSAQRQPPPLVSPAFTPPLTPNGTISLDPIVHPTTSDGPAAVNNGQPDHAASPPPILTPLPTVTCEVRARIPTTTGQEMFLHLYHNSADNKEHLAIVFGPYIRSKSLDAPREGETEKDRMIRGAYVGTLFPGRTTSRRVDVLKREAGVAVSSPGGSGIAAGVEGERAAAGEQSGPVLPMSPVQAPRKTAEDEVREKEQAERDEGQRGYLAEAPYVRIHSECYTGETVWSARCDCGEQLDEAARIMSLSPYGGVIVYLRQEGRGIGLLSKLKAYNLQDLGHDTMQANLLLRHPADARSYGLATAMLVDLGLGGPLGSVERERGIRLLTNNPEKVRAVEGPGREVRVSERVGMVPLAWTSGGKEGVRGKEVEKYISTKIEKFKHMFSA